MNITDVSAVVDHYATAILAGDRTMLDALLDTDYKFVSASAQVVDRERRLTTLATSPDVLADLTFSDIDVRVVHSVAIVRVTFRAEFQPHLRRAHPDRRVSTLILSRHSGKWLLKHQHNSHES